MKEKSPSFVPEFLAGYYLVSTFCTKPRVNEAAAKKIFWKEAFSQLPVVPCRSFFFFRM